MTSTKKDPVLVVFQLSGGNDYLNTVIPYANPIYKDARHTVGIADERVIKIDDKVGFHPEMAPLKKVYDRGDMAIIPCAASAPRTFCHDHVITSSLL